MIPIDNLNLHPDLDTILDSLEPLITSPDSIVDLPPEFCTYHDQGCELAEACLQCPLPQCVDDLPMGRARLYKTFRDARIRHLHDQAHLSIAELAKQFEVNPRTVRRALANK